jgi:broad-specificity NMP kinase
MEICIKGTCGCGKTSISHLIADLLSKHGFIVTIEDNDNGVMTMDEVTRNLKSIIQRDNTIVITQKSRVRY